MSAMSSRTDLVLWLALFVGFSPAIIDFTRGSVVDPSWMSSTLLSPLLIAICVVRRIALEDQPRRIGIALIAAGLLLELVGIVFQIWTIEWLGFPVAVLGMALSLGRPSWRVAVLSFGLVSAPVSVQTTGTPIPETALLSPICAIGQTLGLALSCTGPVARFGDRDLELLPADVGWMLVPVLAQLGWFHALTRGATGLRPLYRAVAFALAGLVVQPLVIGIGLGLLVVSTEGTARAWLSHGSWVSVAGIAVLSAFGRKRGLSARPTDGVTDESDARADDSWMRG